MHLLFWINYHHWDSTVYWCSENTRAIYEFLLYNHKIYLDSDVQQCSVLVGLIVLCGGRGVWKRSKFHPWKSLNWWHFSGTLWMKEYVWLMQAGRCHSLQNRFVDDLLQERHVVWWMVVNSQAVASHIIRCESMQSWYGDDTGRHSSCEQSTFCLNNGRLMQRQTADISGWAPLCVKEYFQTCGTSLEAGGQHLETPRRSKLQGRGKSRHWILSQCRLYMH
jgi:hypothetical protein